MSEDKPIFINYSTNDESIANIVFEYLVKEVGVRENEIFLSSTSPGGHITTHIRDAIIKTKLFIAIITEDYIERPWCSYELGLMNMAHPYGSNDEPNVLPIVISLAREIGLPHFLHEVAHSKGGAIFTALSNKVKVLVPSSFNGNNINNQVNNEYNDKLDSAVKIRKIKYDKENKVCLMKDNPYSKDMIEVIDLITNDKLTYHRSNNFVKEASEDRKYKYKSIDIPCTESRYVLPLTDLTLKYFTHPENLSWFEEELALVHDPKKRIIIIDNKTKDSGKSEFSLAADRFLKQFAHKGYQWMILDRDDLDDRSIQRYFRDFCIFTYKDGSKKAYFTYSDKLHRNLFIKGSWTQYATTNSEYIEKLNGYFQDLWDFGELTNRHIDNCFSKT